MSLLEKIVICLVSGLFLFFFDYLANSPLEKSDIMFDIGYTLGMLSGCFIFGENN